MWNTWKWTIYAVIFYIAVKLLHTILQKVKERKYARNNEINGNDGNDSTNNDGNRSTESN